jgi:hypothetical protein
MLKREGNTYNNIVLYKGRERTDLQKQEDGEAPPLTLEQRQQARQLWQLWWDFSDTVYALLEPGADPTTAAPALLVSIEQFHDQAQALLGSLGLLAQVAPHLTTLTTVTAAVSKAGAIMSAARRQRLQEAIEALQALLDEAIPQESTTTEKGHRMSAWDEIQSRAAILVATGQVSTKHQAVAKVCHDNPALRQQYRAEPRPVLVAKREEPPAQHWSLVQLETMAADLVAKGAAPTRAQAVAQAMKTPQGRELAAAYRQHQRARG